ncbi:methyltransferase domain-containing protein [Streptomyces sp. NPDC047022]|uniref:methyltransferase domain-containing protein n=1 Tax=Streptomyces sp. NPDC047022 TaxID=3155737 RepID=UPI0033DDF67B
MTAATGNITQFTTVDGAPDSSWFIDFMDRANALPGYADIRGILARNLGADVKGKSLLDVGCGTGDDARELAELVGDAGRVVGTDFSEAMIEEATRRSVGSPLPVQFRVEDVGSMSFEDGAFDGVRAKLVLMHCSDLDAAAAELVRVTKDGGRIAVFDYDFESTIVDHPDVAATREIVRCCADGHANRWTGRQLRRRFLDLGLGEVSVTPYTVLMPLSFFRTSVGGRLAGAQQSGGLNMTAEELAAWWQPLEQADENGRFFASLTGFALGATK